MGVALQCATWSARHHVVLPGAVYAGNRFASRAAPYPPMYTPDEAVVDRDVLITDVARLAVAGSSRLELPSHDLATPAIGVFDPVRNEALWILVPCSSRLGAYGFEIEESDDRSSAAIRIMAPVVRRGQRAFMPWHDRPARWSHWDRLELPIRIVRFPCADLAAFHDRFLTLRSESVVGQREPTRPPHCMTFSAATDVLVKKQETRNWREDPGYYASDMNSGDWQLGWVGGIVTAQALAIGPSSITSRRIARTLDFMAASQEGSGYLRGFYRPERGWVGDGFDHPGTGTWTMVRKNADALYFGLKTVALLEAAGVTVTPTWDRCLLSLAEAFSRTWRDHGQFGQLLDEVTGRIVVGGSTAGGLVPAGLLLAAERYAKPALSERAQTSARALYRTWTQRGITLGGPGEILQCPDSESAFALLESLSLLVERTGDPEWLACANEAAAQCATWVVSYDFPFPSDSTLGRVGAGSTGTVIANAQNKHSAPGICTFSGDSLLRLYRASGDLRHAHLLADITRSLGQFLAHPGRTMDADGSVWMCERVNLSDWEGPGKVGYVPPWSCWCEASLLLTAGEVPSVYVDPARRIAIAFDQLTVELSDQEGRLVLHVRNETPHAARARIMIDDGRQLGIHLAQTRAAWVELCIAPGTSAHLDLTADSTPESPPELASLRVAAAS